MSPRFDWLFKDESSPAVVPEMRKTASITQVQRLKKNLKNFASKEELQKLIERVKKHERVAPRRITVYDVYLCRLGEATELITKDHTVQEMVDWCVDNFDDDIDKLRKGRVIDQRRIAYLDTQIVRFRALVGQFEVFKDRLYRLERLILNLAVCPDCGEHLTYLTECRKCKVTLRVGLVERSS